MNIQNQRRSATDSGCLSGVLGTTFVFALIYGATYLLDRDQFSGIGALGTVLLVVCAIIFVLWLLAALVRVPRLVGEQYAVRAQKQQLKRLQELSQASHDAIASQSSGSSQSSQSAGCSDAFAALYWIVFFVIGGFGLIALLVDPAHRDPTGGYGAFVGILLAVAILGALLRLLSHPFFFLWFLVVAIIRALLWPWAT